MLNRFRLPGWLPDATVDRDPERSSQFVRRSPEASSLASDLVAAAKQFRLSCLQAGKKWPCDLSPNRPDSEPGASEPQIRAGGRDFVDCGFCAVAGAL